MSESARLLQEAIVNLVFKHISQFGSLGKCVNSPHRAYPNTVPRMLAAPLKCVHSSKAFRKYNHQPSSHSIPVAQTGNSCEKSFCTSLHSLFLFLVFGFCGFMQRVSPKLFIRTSIPHGNWTPMLTPVIKMVTWQMKGHMRRNSLIFEGQRMVRNASFCN